MQDRLVINPNAAASEAELKSSRADFDIRMNISTYYCLLPVSSERQGLLVEAMGEAKTGRDIAIFRGRAWVPRWKSGVTRLQLAHITDHRRE